jgi:hypothetical protein
MKDYKKPLLEITAFENGQAVMLVSGNYNQGNITPKKSSNDITRNQLDAK